jgi:cytochrome c-type biogenesis protein CcmH/NrfF
MEAVQPWMVYLFLWSPVAVVVLTVVLIVVIYRCKRRSPPAARDSTEGERCGPAADGSSGPVPCLAGNVSSL